MNRASHWTTTADIHLDRGYRPVPESSAFGEISVDADAYPVKPAVAKVATRHAIRIVPL